MAAGSSKELSDGDTIRIGYSLLRVVYPKVAADAKQNNTSTELTMISSLEEVVTSLVADMRGFSAYCQTHASADVYGMINQIFDQFSKIIEDFKGTVKDYAGDSVIAFWEHQFGDPARQSVLACLAVIQQMLSFNQIRVVLSGKYADVENILICSHTAGLVENQFELKDLGMLPIRGREGQEHIFALSAA
jgi:class 3 adenylate cyclase